MIPKIRINNDIKINFDVFRNEVPESFSDAIDIVVVLKGVYGAVINPDYTISDNTITVLARAESQESCDKYSLIVSYKRPNSERDPIYQPFIVDIPAFELVSKSIETTDGTTSENLTVETIFLNGVISVNQSGAQGLSAYQVWMLQEGNEGKTVEEYIEWIQKPSLDAAIAAESSNTSFVAAEGIRVGAENLRVIAEGLRVDAETARYNAEVLRLSAELSREEAEGLRVTAEGLRYDAEALRVTAEAGRVSVEGQRVNDENARKAAELIRVSNDANREVKANKKSVLDPLSETDYPNSKGVANYVKMVTGNENWVGVEFDPTLSCSEPAPKSTDEVYRATELKRTGNLFFHKSGNSRIFNALRMAIVNRVTKEVAWWLSKENPYLKFDGTASNPDWTIHNIAVYQPDIYRRIRIVNAATGRYEVAMDIEPFSGAELVYPKCWHSPGFATVDRVANPLQLVSVMSTDPRFRGGNNNAANDLLPSTQLAKPASVISRTNFENYAANAGWETGGIKDRTLWHDLTALYFANTNIQLEFTNALTAEGYPQGGNGPGVTTWSGARWAAKNGYYPLHNIGEGFMTVGCKVGVKNMVDEKYYIGKVSSVAPNELKATAQFATGAAWNASYIGYTVQNMQTLSEAIIVSKTDDDTLVLDDDIFTDASHWFWIKGVNFTYQIPVFFGLEHLYGEIWDWVSGVNIEKSADTANGGTGLSKAYVCTDFSKRAATITPDYKYIGLVPRVNGYVKELYREFAIYKEGGAGSNTYMSDYAEGYTTIPATGTVVYGLLFGARASHGVTAGVRYSYSNSVPSHASATFGARLRAKIG